MVMVYLDVQVSTKLFFLFLRILKSHLAVIFATSGSSDCL